MENQGENFIHVEQVEHVEFCGDTPRRGFLNAENAKAPKNLCDLCVEILVGTLRTRDFSRVEFSRVEVEKNIPTCVSKNLCTFASLRE